MELMREIINKEIHLARNLNATHLVVTHFDEMNNATKLWLFSSTIRFLHCAFVMGRM